MARFLVFDDFHAFGEMMALPLIKAGHEVMLGIAEDGPLDFDRLLDFRPQAVCVGMFRRKEAFNRPIEDWTRDVQGYQPIHEMEGYPAIEVLPILFAGMGLIESDIHTRLNYDVFLTLPQEIGKYVPVMEGLAKLPKKRRRLSELNCCECRSRLVYMREPAVDLFCPRCHASITIVDDEHVLVSTDASKDARPRPLSDLQPG